jgi:hypothetical protein
MFKQTLIVANLIQLFITYPALLLISGSSRRRRREDDEDEIISDTNLWNHNLLPTSTNWI